MQAYRNAVAIPYAASQVPPVVSGTNATTVPTAPTIVFLNVGDYVQVYANTDVSGLGIFANVSNQSYMTVVWMHA